MSQENPCIQAAINDFLIRGFESKCAYVQANCGESTSTVDFFSFYYCNLNEDFAYFVPFSLVFIFIMFYAVSSTAENYLEPVLTKIARIFRFSESLAGVTLVALANGASDVISAWAAGGNEDTGVLLPLGALFGAGIFTLTLILCVSILVSPGKKIQTDRASLTRDCFFYLLACAYFLVFGFIGKIYLWTILGVFFMYFVFICVAVYYEVKHRRRERERLLQENTTRRRGPSFELSFFNDSVTIDEYMTESALSPDASTFGGVNPDDSVASFILPPDLQKQVDSNRRAMGKYASHSTHSKMLFEFHSLRHKMRKEISEIVEKNCIGKIFHFVKFPLEVVRKATITSSHEGDWSKKRACFQPFLTSVFLLWQFGCLEAVFSTTFNIVIWAVSCLIFSVIIWRFTRSKQVPQGILSLILLVIAFTASGAWINFISNIIVDYITLLSVFTGLPLNYIGLTLLAWGNSLPDFFVDTTLAKKGLGQAAISGIFAGQYFNLAIGFGLALLRQVLKKGPIDFDLKDFSNSNIVNILLMTSVIIALLITMIYGHRNKYILKKDLGYFLLGFYGVFFVAVTALSLF